VPVLSQINAVHTLPHFSLISEQSCSKCNTEHNNFVVHSKTTISCNVSIVWQLTLIIFHLLEKGLGRDFPKLRKQKHCSDPTAGFRLVCPLIVRGCDVSEFGTHRLTQLMSGRQLSHLRPNQIESIRCFENGRQGCGAKAARESQISCWWHTSLVQPQHYHCRL
jgi:hypothetical protein